MKTLFSDRFNEWYARAVGPYFSSTSRPLKGVWRNTFTYESRGVEYKVNHLVSINQIGFIVYANTIAGDLPHDKLSGLISERKFFTGTWSNKGGNVAHGAFQMSITPDGEEMDGKWVGFNRSNEIGQGIGNG